MKNLRMYLWPLILLLMAAPASAVDLKLRAIDADSSRYLTVPADSFATQDTVNALEIRVETDSVRLDSVAGALAGVAAGTGVDSLKFHYGTAGDTTSPGFCYTLMPDGLYYRTDPSDTTKAWGIAVDSVPKGASCRFQKMGRVSIPWYDFSPPGVKLVNSSDVAGGIVVVDSTRADTLKMQGVARATEDSTTIDLQIDPLIYFWSN